MKIYYPDGCDQEWRDSLTPWQVRQLRALHRQGRGLRDRTDHGSDRRWMQRGVRTRGPHPGGPWRRTSPTDRYGHEAVIIKREPYGFRMLGVARATVHSIDPETGGDLQEMVAWQVVWIEYVSDNSTANFAPDSDAARRMRESKERLRRATA